MTIPIYSAPNDEASVEPTLGGVGVVFITMIWRYEPMAYKDTLRPCPIYEPMPLSSQCSGCGG